MPRFICLLRNGPLGPPRGPPYPPLPRFLIPLPPRLLSRRMLLLCLINWSSDISRLAVFVSMVAVIASPSLPALGSRIQHRQNSLSTLCTLQLSGKSTLKINDDGNIRSCFYNNADDRTSFTALMWNLRKHNSQNCSRGDLKNCNGWASRIGITYSTCLLCAIAPFENHAHSLPVN